MDKLNLHSCMISIVYLFKRMKTNHIVSSTINSQTEMSPWIICLYKKTYNGMVYIV
ncbi:unnamed protein product, partial [Rotaria sordida]